MQKNICEVKPVQKHRFLVLQFDQDFDQIQKNICEVNQCKNKGSYFFSLIKCLIQKNICEVKPVKKHRFLVLQFDQDFDAKKRIYHRMC